MKRCASTMLLLLLKFGALWLWMTSSLCAGDQQFLSRTFLHSNVCHIEERLRQNCAQEKPHTKSLLDCVRLCSQDDLCVGASLDETSQSCITHQMCSPTVQCGPPDTRHVYWESYCVHGHWDSATGSCRCLFETFGDRCDQYLQGCPPGLRQQPALIDLQENGNQTEPMAVLCDGKFIFVAQNSGKSVFNRTYQEYVRGFWADQSNFWTGLKHLNRFSSHTRYTMMSTIVTLDGGLTGYWHMFQNFIVRGDDEDFTFSAENFAQGTEGNIPPGHLGDCLVPLQDTPFSAWDSDRDGASDQNCASVAGSGWWYSGCDIPCNLLGWGLDDWDATPPRQRLSANSLDIEIFAARVNSVRLGLEIQS